MAKLVVDRVKVVEGPLRFSPGDVTRERLVEIGRPVWPDSPRYAQEMAEKLRVCVGWYLGPKMFQHKFDNWHATRKSIKRISTLAEQLAAEVDGLNPLYVGPLLLAAEQASEELPRPADLRRFAALSAQLGAAGGSKGGPRSHYSSAEPVRHLVRVVDEEISASEAAREEMLSNWQRARLQGEVLRRWFALVDPNLQDQTRKRLIASARKRLAEDNELRVRDRNLFQQMQFLSRSKVTPF